MYEYLIGIAILAVVWAVCYFVRKDLRKPMIWSGFAYLFVIVSYFLIWRMTSFFIPLGQPIVPTYWNPDTLFDLGRITGGLAIEDILFMIFAGGIATFIYEFSFGKRIVIRRTYHPHIRAIFIGYLVSFLVMFFAQPNPIYPLIAFGFAGAIVLWIDRRDLVIHSLVGGFGFLVIYGAAFLFFALFFSEFILSTYSFSEISGITFFGIPLEEFLYAFSFGLLWAPLYEYAHGERDAPLNVKK